MNTIKCLFIFAISLSSLAIGGCTSTDSSENTDLSYMSDSSGPEIARGGSPFLLGMLSSLSGSSTNSMSNSFGSFKENRERQCKRLKSRGVQCRVYNF